LQWRRVSFNAALLFFMVNIGLSYDTPLKTRKAEMEVSSANSKPQMACPSPRKILQSSSKVESASSCKIFMVCLLLLKCAGVCAGNVLLTQKYKGASAEARKVVWNSCTLGL